jgi:hypothetical protein
MGVLYFLSFCALTTFAFSDISPALKEELVSVTAPGSGPLRRSQWERIKTLLLVEFDADPVYLSFVNDRAYPLAVIDKPIDSSGSCDCASQACRFDILWEEICSPAALSSAPVLYDRAGANAVSATEEDLQNIDRRIMNLWEQFGLRHIVEDGAGNYDALE